MNSTLRSIVAMVSIASTGMAVAVLPTGASAHNATQSMNAGVYCFRIGEPIPGGWTTTLKMVVSRVGNPGIGYFRNAAPINIAHVDAVEHGTQATYPPNTYVTPLTGAATIAPGQVSGDNQIQVSLNGSDFGVKQVGGATGIWITSHAITLNLPDLTGHDTAFKTFTPIDAGQPGESERSAIDETLTPIPCSEF